MDSTTLRMGMRLALSGVATTFWALTLCSNASAEDVVLPPSNGIPVCTSGPRLRAVQYDPNRENRSFALFNGSAQAQPMRQGSHVGPYTIERIERGAVVLATHSQRCSVRLHGELASRELRAVSADAVRFGLRARQPTAAAPDAASGDTNRNGPVAASPGAKRALSSG